MLLSVMKSGVYLLTIWPPEIESVLTENHEAVAKPIATYTYKEIIILILYSIIFMQPKSDSCSLNLIAKYIAL